MTNNKPMEWQTNPDSLDDTLSGIQYWKNGCMITAQLKVSGAKELVRKGQGFVMTSQAVGAIDENGNRNS